jgi:hypothetical protein
MTEIEMNKALIEELIDALDAAVIDGGLPEDIQTMQFGLAKKLRALLDAPIEPLTGKCGQCKSSKVPCGCNTGVAAGIKALLSAPSEPKLPEKPPVSQWQMLVPAAQNATGGCIVVCGVHPDALQKLVAEHDTALAALRAEPVSEPAYYLDRYGMCYAREQMEFIGRDTSDMQPLYLAAPQSAPLTEKQIKKLWECIYDHGNGKYLGDASKEQRDEAFAILDSISAPKGEAL